MIPKNRNTRHHTHTLKWFQDIIGIHIKFSFHKKYGVQEKVEGHNVLTISMCFSGEVFGKSGDYKEYKE